MRNTRPELIQNSSNKDINTAKKVLGASATALREPELKEVVMEIRFLVESWLDDFERKAFEGKTLQEYLQEDERR